MSQYVQTFPLSSSQGPLSSSGLAIERYTPHWRGSNLKRHISCSETQWIFDIQSYSPLGLMQNGTLTVTLITARVVFLWGYILIEVVLSWPSIEVVFNLAPSSLYPSEVCLEVQMGAIYGKLCTPVQAINSMLNLSIEYCILDGGCCFIGGFFFDPQFYHFKPFFLFF